MSVPRVHFEVETPTREEPFFAVRKFHGPEIQARAEFERVKAEQPADLRPLVRLRRVTIEQLD